MLRRTSESKGNVISIRVVSLYDVNNSVRSSVFTDKHVFYHHLDMCMTLTWYWFDLDTVLNW